MTAVLILKTNISSQTDEERLAHFLDNNDAIERWNVDREDIDKILRVETDHLETIELISLVEASGFECAELED